MARKKAETTEETTKPETAGKPAKGEKAAKAVAPKKSAVSGKAGDKSAATVQAYGLIHSPVITEKSSLVGGGGRTVVFRVDRNATKDDIRSAVERVFKVDVEAVRTCNYMGKPKRTTRSLGRRAAFKKAYVTLREGQTIDLVEGV